MELAILTTALTEIYKFLAKRMGDERAKKLIHVFVLLCASLFVVLQNHGILTTEVVTTIVTTYVSSVGLYEIVVKRLVYPVLNKVAR